MALPAFVLGVMVQSLGLRGLGLSGFNVSEELPKMIQGMQFKLERS